MANEPTEKLAQNAMTTWRIRWNASASRRIPQIPP